jgi:hypothetical protein
MYFHPFPRSGLTPGQTVSNDLAWERELLRRLLSHPFCSAEKGKGLWDEESECRRGPGERRKMVPFWCQFHPRLYSALPFFLPVPSVGPTRVTSRTSSKARKCSSRLEAKTSTGSGTADRTSRIKKQTQIRVVLFPIPSQISMWEFLGFFSPRLRYKRALFFFRSPPQNIFHAIRTWHACTERALQREQAGDGRQINTK